MPGWTGSLELQHATAAEDGPECRIALPQDPGQAGKAQAQATLASGTDSNPGAAPLRLRP